ncbi:MAG TPA: sigma-54-dependent Fis family transcriptional regulator [Acidiferrobacteraceae bacterium]|nr:sigma-54-dependent Fis family transcriptional regulator [Acidiferrobacteraceae bacterium]
MATAQILIVDDEPDIRELLEMTLRRMDLQPASAEDLGHAQRLLEQQHFDLCLTDMRLPDGDGIDLVRHIQAHYPNTPVAVITAHGNMDSAISALKAGAFDFLSKPLELNNLRNIITHTLKLSTATRPSERRSRGTLLGESQAIRDIRGIISKLARSQAPVYIGGESGTGKELVARLIHQLGPRADAPFVPVNCGAIPCELMESEFFGHIKGSFTGAIKDKLGLFQAAEGGTLFLDEVAELPLLMQVKLLRAIQEKAVRPVGAESEIPIDVRILSATHKDLAAMVNASQFRQDLFYRINVIGIHVPSLKEHPEDIPLLTDHILESLVQREGGRIPTLDRDTRDALDHYPYPGNVRELENILERALTLSEGGNISVAHLALPIQANQDNAANQPLEDHLKDVERQSIETALQKTQHNKTAAAKLLGISFRALRYKLDKLGMK